MQISTIEVILALAVLASICISVFLYFKVTKLINTYKQLTKGVRGDNLVELLSQHFGKIEKSDKKIIQIQQALEDFKKSSNKHFQKIGFRRYNPFHETGGNQSFILIMLDQNNNGVILSSLHQREVTRVYAKLVQNGETEHKLSKEEEELLGRTMKK